MTEYKFKPGARPIETQAVHDHYLNYQFAKPTVESYTQSWYQWLTNSDTKTLLGLEQFSHRDYTCGTSHAFDHFVLRHSRQRQIVVFAGDFQYHACISKQLDFAYVSSVDKLRGDLALIISVPFSDLGTTHPEFDQILSKCDQLSIPVCLDLAYWGIAKNVFLDLNQHQCVQEITASLSKPFYTLENHRIGVRFSRHYLDDGISMLNEVHMPNFYSMGLGMHFMHKFSCDWNWQHHGNNYYNRNR
jgi:hypothetical protein